MRLIAIARAPEGSELGRDVLIGRPDGIPLLRAGVKLTARYRERLVEAGVAAIYVEDELSEGIIVEPIVDDETRAIATRVVSGAFETARDAVSAGKPIQPTPLEPLQSVVERILKQISNSGGVALALADLSSADAYTFQHSIDVTALGLLIGKRHFHDKGWTDDQGQTQYAKIDEPLSSLGLGLLLHDIGKLAISHAILNKPGELTPAEWEIMKSHPRLGVELLSGAEWSPVVKAIVLRHHERWNGSGYPDGQLGEQIHQMARIAAVADVYDAATSERVYAPARPACDGVKAVLEGSGTLFDPDVAESFSRIVAPFPPGVEITLADGRRGVVVSVPEHSLARPDVRILEGPGAPYEISLSRDPSVRVKGWDSAARPAAAA